MTLVKQLAGRAQPEASALQLAHRLVDPAQLVVSATLQALRLAPFAQLARAIP